MLICITLESEVPIYTQLRNEILRGIAEGRIHEKESLPSVRQMAVDLGVNMHTVNKAYNQLKHEGFLSVHRRKGVVVNDPTRYKANEEFKDKLEAELQELVIEARCRAFSLDNFYELVKELYVKEDFS